MFRKNESNSALKVVAPHALAHTEAASAPQTHLAYHAEGAVRGSNVTFVGAWLGIIAILGTDVAWAFSPLIYVGSPDKNGRVEVFCPENRELESMIRLDSGRVTLVNNPGFSGALELNSQLPIVMNSFVGSELKIFAPGIEILGSAKIDNFKITNPLSLLHIGGKLTTKDIFISGRALIDGELNICEGGKIDLDYSCCADEYSLINNGRISTPKDLKINNPLSLCSILNNGTFASQNLFFSANTFTNGQNGKIQSNNVTFELGIFLWNLGYFKANNLLIKQIPALGLDPNFFHQLGILDISGTATLNCDMMSKGTTNISQLLFPSRSHLFVKAQSTNIGDISGTVGILRAEGGATARISRINGSAEYIEGENARLAIGGLESRERTYVMSNWGADVSIGNIKADISSLFMQRGNLHVENVSGKSYGYANGGSLAVQNASNLDLVTSGGASASVRNSNVGNAYLSGSSSFTSTKSNDINNSGSFYGTNTRTTDFHNSGNASFSGNTTAGNIYSSGSASFSGSTTATNIATSGSAAFSGNTTVEQFNNSGNASFKENTTAGNINNSGNASFRGNTSAGNIYSSGSAFFRGNTTATNISTSGSASFSGSTTAGNIYSSGSASFSGSTTARNIYNSGSASFSGSTTARNIYSSGNASFRGNTSAGNINNSGNTSFSGSTTAGNIYSSESASFSGSTTAGNIYSSESASFSGSTTAGNITNSGTFISDGNTTARNIYNSGSASFSGSTTAGNITNSGTFISDGTTTATSINNSGNSAFSGNTTATNITNFGNAAFSGNTSAGNIHSSGTFISDGNTTATNITTSGNAAFSGSTTAGNIHSSGTFISDGSTTATNITTSGNASFSGSTFAGNISNSGNASFYGNTTAGNISNSGDASFCGNTFAGNITNSGNESFSGTTSAKHIHNHGTLTSSGKTTATHIHNHGTLISSGKTTAKHVHNSGDAAFSGKTSAKHVHNHGTLVSSGTTTAKHVHNSGKTILGGAGAHKIGTYTGTEDSLLKVEGKSENASEKAAGVVRLNANVNIKKIEGAGTIEAAHQVYAGMVPTNFYIKGDAEAFVGYLPEPREVPKHEGNFDLRATLASGFLNLRDIDYGDTQLHLDMTGHGFANIGASFSAGGLEVRNAKNFNNIHGRMNLRKFFIVEAENFSNEGRQTEKDNSRVVDQGWHHGVNVRFVMPAKYYEKDPNTYIRVADGPVKIFAARGDIHNSFASIMAANGPMHLCAPKGNVENISGDLMAFGEYESIIEAQKFINRDMPHVVRKGEFSASGSSGGGGFFGGLFGGSSSWSIYVCCSDLVNQSAGSNATFGGSLAVKAEVVNQGSIIRAGGMSVDGSVIQKDHVANKASIQVEQGGLRVKGEMLKADGGKIVALSGGSINVQAETISVKGTKHTPIPETPTGYRDYDLSEILLSRYHLSNDNFTPSFIKVRGLNDSIPFIGSKEVGDVSLNNITIALSCLNLPLGGIGNFLNRLANNNAARFGYQAAEIPSRNAIPDEDCLFYENSHLFLRISSAKKKEVNDILRTIKATDVYADKSLKIETERSLKMHGVVLESGHGHITLDGKHGLLYSAGSQMMAPNGKIYLSAAKQIYETIIKKAIDEHVSSNYGYHYEWVENVVRQAFIAREIRFAGGEAELRGVYIDAKRLYDETKYMLLTGAKERLYYWSWAKKKTLLSSRAAGVDGYYDVMVPTLISCDHFISTGSKNHDDPTKLEMRGVTIEGKTPESSFVCTKDSREDRPFVVESYERKWEHGSGISIGGRIRVNNPLANLPEFANAQNKTGLATAIGGLNAVATTVKLCESFKKVGSSLKCISRDMPVQGYTGLVSTLMNFVSGPKLSIGFHSMEATKHQTKEVGNTVRVGTMEARCPLNVILCGDYDVRTGIIRTKNFQTMGRSLIFDSTMEQQEAGVSVDLLKAFVGFCIGYFTGNYSMMLSATSVSGSEVTSNSHQELHVPTRMRGGLWDIEAENGHISHTQIIGDTVRAIFTENLTVETLADLMRSSTQGSSFSVSGGLLNAASAADAASSCSVGNIDQTSFQTRINEFASIVSRGELILEAKRLHTKSAKIGNAFGDKSKEHINVGEWIDEEVAEDSYARDNSFQLDGSNFVAVGKAAGDFLDKIEAGIPEKDRREALAQISSEEEVVARTTDELEDNNARLRDRIKSKVGDAEVENLVNGREVSSETKKAIASELNGALNALQHKKDAISQKAPLGLKDAGKTISDTSAQTQISIIDDKISQYQQMLFALTLDREPVQPKLTRSGSKGDLLQDTFVRQGGQALKTTVGAMGNLSHEANDLEFSDYVDLQRSHLPTDMQDDPRACAQLQQGYLLYKGFAKVGQGLSAVDDMTGNVASGVLRKIGEGCEWLGTQVRRTMRDDLGFSQRTAQNTGDIAEIAAQIFGPKAIGSVAKMPVVAAGVTKFRNNLAGAFTRAEQIVPLNWDFLNGRVAHVMEHGAQNLGAVTHGVFYGDPIAVTNEAWEIVQRMGIKPTRLIDLKGRPCDCYIVPRQNSGYCGGAIGAGENLNYVGIATKPGTNRVITAFPSHSTTFEMRSQINGMLYGSHE